MKALWILAATARPFEAPAAATPEVELTPMVPGAWRAWAERTSAAPVRPAATTQAPAAGTTPVTRRAGSAAG